ncbi:TetR/AcrR family transcriptional regulator [Oceaniglobus trochenteri]|uniref:TetR/AcrR family transcriptional regulator n=1 Tax=Oceaniglobus trochenteri TaxID=2763260 RepID=UPI001CFFE47E|nr:TetR/AcrR family transcriptional regulator [Oceaniglobus trochenteri]
MARRAPRRHDAEAARADILAAALAEFAEHGHAGARIDRIAKASGMSKPMIYSYFTDKDGLYAAALREAYVQIREGERTLHLTDFAPSEAIAALVSFTLDHFIEKPWFVSMLNTENLRGGNTIADIGDLSEIQSHLVREIGLILDRGVAEGRFRAGVDPVELYITVASLCYFPVANRHTLKSVFGRDIAHPPQLAERRKLITQMVLAWLEGGS